MSKLKNSAGEIIHKRSITIDSSVLNDEEFIFTGTLVDMRFKENILLTGEIKPPGPIHHMIIRLLVKFPEFIIKEIEVEMPAYPRPQCIETKDCLMPLVGTSIGSGFTRNVKNAAGGIKGCAHLVKLVLAMAPAIIQGYWSYRSGKKESYKDSDLVEKMLDLTADTCHVWRKDGETIHKIRNTDREDNIYNKN
jgi:hypothetical protein